MLLLENDQHARTERRTPNRNMANTPKPPSELQIIEWLQTIGGQFPPAVMKVVNRTQLFDDGPEADAVIEATVGQRKYRFAAEVKTLSTPKIIQSAIEQARQLAQRLRINPLIVTPYLGEEQLRALERQGLSGLDMCGNCILQVPGELLIFRTGARNKFPRGAPIRNIYRGTSSIVTRTFALRPKYNSLNDLLAETGQRGAAMTRSTISKVCSTLVDDLIITREKRERETALRLLQPDKLLDNLAKNFAPPTVQASFTGKCSLAAETLISVLQTWSKENSERIVLAGSSSANSYATMAREPIMRFYCTNAQALLKRLGRDISRESRFPNSEFQETDDPTVYFDGRDNLVASPVQSYLELQSGDKREQDTAVQLRTLLITQLNTAMAR